MNAYGIQRTDREEPLWLGVVRVRIPARLLWTVVCRDALWFARADDAEAVRTLLHDPEGPLGRVSRASTRVERLGCGSSYGPYDYRPDWPLVTSIDELRQIGLAATTWRVGVRVASWEHAEWACACNVVLDDAELAWLRFWRVYTTDAPGGGRMWHVEYDVVFRQTLGATGFGKPLEV